MRRKRLPRGFKARNQRRGDLITKLFREGLTPEEQTEYEALQERTMREIDETFPFPEIPPLPPFIKELLAKHEQERND